MNNDSEEPCGLNLLFISIDFHWFTCYPDIDWIHGNSTAIFPYFNSHWGDRRNILTAIKTDMMENFPPIGNHSVIKK